MSVREQWAEREARARPPQLGSPAAVELTAPWAAPETGEIALDETSLDETGRPRNDSSDTSGPPSATRAKSSKLRPSLLKRVSSRYQTVTKMEDDGGAFLVE